MPEAIAISSAYPLTGFGEPPGAVEAADRLATGGVGKPHSTAKRTRRPLA